MSQKVALTVVAGPMKGEVFPLPTDRSTKIGRGSRGVRLTMDEHASLDHAEIVPGPQGFMIHDLGSHRGTFVNGVRVQGSPVPLDMGSVIEVGSSVLQVGEPSNVSVVVGITAAIGGPVLLTMAVLAWLFLRPVHYEPVLHSNTEVRQVVRNSPDVPIPLDFVRAHGVDHRSLQLYDVSDFDHDSVDEIWIRGGAYRYLVTFGERGEWKVLGKLPNSCTERKTREFPDLVCGGLVYVMGADGYEPAGMDGVVAWVRLVDEALAPYRMSLPYIERLKGFLVERGVDEPIHYLICEEAVRGLRAQVLTASGNIVPLAYGCLGGLRVTGAGTEPSILDQKPEAFAFTVTGYDALIDDVTTFLGGGPDGLFLDGYQRGLIAELSKEPVNQAGLRVTFLADAEEGDPRAPEGLAQQVRLLARSPQADPQPPPEVAVNVRSQGVATLDPPGCAELEVTTRAWHCKLARWCLPSRNFLVVKDVGCGAPTTVLHVPYSGGYASGKAGGVHVTAWVDVFGGSGQVDVLRTRVGYRVPPEVKDE